MRRPDTQRLWGVTFFERFTVWYLGALGDTVGSVPYGMDQVKG